MKLATEEKQLNQQYVTLKAEVKEIEQIRRVVSEIMREKNRREQPTRKHGIER